MKKMTKKSLDELAKIMPVITESEQRLYVGGSGYFSVTYTGSYAGTVSGIYYDEQEAYNLMDSGKWTGGYVKSYSGQISYWGGEAEVSGQINSGWFGTIYVGPTPDWVMKLSPTPCCAVDSIAKRHDIGYANLGLSGVDGVFSGIGIASDRQLIIDCEDLIKAYESGEKYFDGYPLTKKDYDIAKAMLQTFRFTMMVSGQPRD